MVTSSSFFPHKRSDPSDWDMGLSTPGPDTWKGPTCQLPIQACAQVPRGEACWAGSGFLWGDQLVGGQKSCLEEKQCRNLYLDMHPSPVLQTAFLTITLEL